MSKYLVTESSPSTTSYIRCGRGGAGNTFRASSSSSSSPITTTTTTTTTSSSSSSAKKASSSRRFFSGIGGAGNAHAVSELPSVTLSLDDAVCHAAARDNASVGYCGRGGAGNVYRRKDSDASSSSSSSASASSAGSLKSNMSSTAKLWNRLSGSSARD